MATTIAAAGTQFGEKFREFIKWEFDPALAELRRSAFQAFQNLGFPTTVRNEDWKYTSIAPIAREDWSVEHRRSGDKIASDISEKIGAFRTSRNGFTALNVAFGEFAVLRIAADTSIEAPLQLSLGSSAGTAAFPHIIVIAEPGSRATIVESYASPDGLTDTAIQIFVGDNANLTHYRVQRDAPTAYHVGTTEVTLGRASRYDSTNINLGSAISRHDIDLRFTAEGGEAWVDGLYMLNGTQHSDTHSSIDHQVPNCISRQTYRGVLNDSSRAVFNGKVFVRENAHGTDAQQSNKNLLLSDTARVDTKPQLEIFNDDVKCSHGATVGQLEQEELFYLLTRGLPESLARNLLTYGFAEQIIDKIAIADLRSSLESAVLNRLNTELRG